MFAEQVIFTSLRTRQKEGYQIAATSGGVSPALAHELDRWGPAHDSLVEGATSSINAWRLESGDHCISRTLAAGDEYSGRGGARIYTQMLIVPPDLMEKFSNHPFAILEAADASGQMPVYDTMPARLEQVRLLGRAGLVNSLRLAELTLDPGLEPLFHTLAAALAGPLLAVHHDRGLERLLQGVLWLLPLRWRARFSFTTALRSSKQRPLQWSPLPTDPQERRAWQRATNGTILDLAQGGSPPPQAPRRGWVALLKALFAAKQRSLLPELLRRADRYDPAELSLDQVAERVEEEILSSAR